MQNYLAIHYNGTSTTFTYTSTEEEARNHLATLIEVGLVRPHHTMSITRLMDEKLIYYKRAYNTIDSLSRRPSGYLASINTLLTYWLNRWHPLTASVK